MTTPTTANLPGSVANTSQPVTIVSENITCSSITYRIGVPYAIGNASSSVYVAISPDGASSSDNNLIYTAIQPFSGGFNQSYSNRQNTTFVSFSGNVRNSTKSRIAGFEGQMVLMRVQLLDGDNRQVELASGSAASASGFTTVTGCGGVLPASTTQSVSQGSTIASATSVTDEPEPTGANSGGSSGNDTSGGGGSNVPVAALAGVIGGVAILVILGVAWILWRKKFRNKDDEEDENAGENHFTDKPSRRLFGMGQANGASSPSFHTIMAGGLSTGGGARNGVGGGNGIGLGATMTGSHYNQGHEPFQGRKGPPENINADIQIIGPLGAKDSPTGTYSSTHSTRHMGGGYTNAGATIPPVPVQSGPGNDHLRWDAPPPAAGDLAQSTTANYVPNNSSPFGVESVSRSGSVTIFQQPPSPFGVPGSALHNQGQGVGGLSGGGGAGVSRDGLPVLRNPFGPSGPVSGAGAGAGAGDPLGGGLDRGSLASPVLPTGYSSRDDSLASMGTAIPRQATSGKVLTIRPPSSISPSTEQMPFPPAPGFVDRPFGAGFGQAATGKASGGNSIGHMRSESMPMFTNPVWGQPIASVPPMPQNPNYSNQRDSASTQDEEDEAIDDLHNRTISPPRPLPEGINPVYLQDNMLRHGAPMNGPSRSTPSLHETLASSRIASPSNVSQPSISNLRADGPSPSNIPALPTMPLFAGGKGRSDSPAAITDTDSGEGGATAPLASPNKRFGHKKDLSLAGTIAGSISRLPPIAALFGGGNSGTPPLAPGKAIGEISSPIVAPAPTANVGSIRPGDGGRMMPVSRSDPAVDADDTRSETGSMRQGGGGGRYVNESPLLSGPVARFGGNVPAAGSSFGGGSARDGAMSPFSSAAMTGGGGQGTSNGMRSTDSSPHNNIHRFAGLAGNDGRRQHPMPPQMQPPSHRPPNPPTPGSMSPGSHSSPPRLAMPDFDARSTSQRLPQPQQPSSGLQIPVMLGHPDSFSRGRASGIDPLSFYGSEADGYEQGEDEEYVEDEQLMFGERKDSFIFGPGASSFGGGNGARNGDLGTANLGSGFAVVSEGSDEDYDDGLMSPGSTSQPRQQNIYDQVQRSFNPSGGGGGAYRVARQGADSSQTTPTQGYSFQHQQQYQYGGGGGGGAYANRAPSSNGHAF